MLLSDLLIANDLVKNNSPVHSIKISVNDLQRRHTGFRNSIFLSFSRKFFQFVCSTRMDLFLLFHTVLKAFGDLQSKKYFCYIVVEKVKANSLRHFIL